MAERLKKVLVAYSSMSGCTTTIARRIGVDLIAYDARPVVVSVSEKSVIDPDVDAVVFGSGIRIGKFHKEARDWLIANIDILNARPLALFSVGLRAAQAQTEGLDERDLDEAMHAAGRELNPCSSVVFPGWKRSEGFSNIERLALRVYPLADGDYRDWDKVDAWVRQTAPMLLGYDMPHRCMPIRK